MRQSSDSARCAISTSRPPIYQLDKFVAYGPREGSAAAITEQRHAINIKNVVAMDFFGNLPNLSAGEVAIRLPGVAAGLDDEGNVTGVIIRGQAANNTASPLTVS